MTVDPRVQAFLAGDERAGAALLGELLPRVRNLTRTFLGGDAEVDDVAQQVLIQVVQSMASYRAEGSLVSWVNRITVRTALAHARKRRARAARDLPLADSSGGGETATEVSGQDLGAGWDAYHQRRLAVKMLDRLPVEQRSVIVMHHMLGLSVPEIAEEETISFETVRSRLRLGMSKLREWALGNEAQPNEALESELGAPRKQEVAQ
ncbi:MAG TPA: RNA polymerase sigma factor [Polyangiaceae bacterium]|nr:RNA polymerase sigma factor [Polyangiaceae bacterium]